MLIKTDKFCFAPNAISSLSEFFRSGGWMGGLSETKDNLSFQMKLKLNLSLARVIECLKKQEDRKQ